MQVPGFRPARHGAAGIKPRYMFAPDQGDHFAKAGAMQFDQALAVGVFFGGHFIKDRRAGRKVDAQPFAIAAIDTGVVLFRGNGEGQYLLFR